MPTQYVTTLNTFDGIITLQGSTTAQINSASQVITVSADGLGLSTDFGNSTAWGQANTAFANAGTAQTTANTAVTDAATAQAAANAAQGTANTALANAGTAQTTADTAVSNAATAQSIANAAQTTANTAIADAASAQATANTALADAATASAAAAAADATAVGAAAAAATADATAVAAGAAASAAAATAATALAQSGVTSVNAGTGAISVNAGTGITVGTSGSVITVSANSIPVYQATYYKSVAQNIISGNTDITFDSLATWNNTGGFITHVNGTTDFTVVISGLYQLNFNTVVLINNSTWVTGAVGANKSISIDNTRPTFASVTLFTNASAMAVNNYGQSISGIYYLLANDVLNMRVGNTYTLSGVTAPQVQAVTNTFDFNTFFSWRFISP
jgi:hypothetical protein